jgi:hypothetical protein
MYRMHTIDIITALKWSEGPVIRPMEKNAQVGRKKKEIRGEAYLRRFLTYTIARKIAIIVGAHQ